MTSPFSYYRTIPYNTFEKREKEEVCLLKNGPFSITKKERKRRKKAGQKQADITRAYRIAEEELNNKEAEGESKSVIQKARDKLRQKLYEDRNAITEDRDEKIRESWNRLREG